MKRFIPIVLVLAACGGRFKAPPAVPNVPLPSGDALKPWDPAHPGLARPLGIAELGGKAYVALGNYDAGFTPRGPGHLASFVPSTGTVSLIDLGGAGEKECISAGWVRTADGLLYVTCSGDFNTGAGTAVVEVNPSGQGTVSKRFAAPVSPAAVAITSNRVWFGSALSGAVYALDRTTFALAAGPVTLTCPTSGYQTTNDLAVVNGELYALCSNNLGGVLNRLDATSGVLKGTADAGPIAAAMTQTGDGRIAIVSGADNKLRLVTISANQLAVQPGYTFSGQTSTLQDVRGLNQFVFTAASGSNTVQKIDLSASGGPSLVDEKSVGSCDQETGVCPGPWNILPLDDDQALVTNQGSSTIVAVKWSH
jgi:hypothetical protein